jgi:hypothetical protein
MVFSPPSFIPGWNIEVKNFLCMVFEFGSSLVHNNRMLLFLHKDNLQLSTNIRGYSKAYHFFILKEWTGLNHWPITSARDSSKTVSDSCLDICFILLNS